MKRSREQARDKLLQSLVGLTEAQEVLIELTLASLRCSFIYIRRALAFNLQAIGQCEVNVLLTSKF
jgi:hypothetical protein